MLDFDTVCEQLTDTEDSVIKIEQKMVQLLGKYPESNIYLFSFAPIRTFNFLGLEDEEKRKLVRTVLEKLKQIFGDKLIVLGRHALVWEIDKKTLEKKLFDLVKTLKEEDEIPIYIGVIKVDKNLSPQQTILDLERCLFMPMCVPDQMLMECLVRFCEDLN